MYVYYVSLTPQVWAVQVVVGELCTSVVGFRGLGLRGVGLRGRVCRA